MSHQGNRTCQANYYRKRGLDYSLGGLLTVFRDTEIGNTVQGVRVKGDFDSNYLLFLGGTLRYVF